MPCSAGAFPVVSFSVLRAKFRVLHMLSKNYVTGRTALLSRLGEGRCFGFCYTWFFVFMYVYTPCACSALRGQKRESDPLEL